MIRIQQSNSDASVLFLGTRTQPAAPDLEVTPGVARPNSLLLRQRPPRKRPGKRMARARARKILIARFPTTAAS